MRLTASILCLYCLVALLPGSIFQGNALAQSLTEIDSGTVELESDKDQLKLNKHTVYMPLYLDLIEFSKLSEEALEEAKEALKKKQKIDLQDNLSLNPFHQRNSLSLKEKMAVAEQSFCRSCHLPLPHQKNIRSRSFNNMHSRYIACETCHLDKEKLANVDKLEYLWFDFERNAPIKEPQDLLMIVNDQNLKIRPASVKITPFYQQRVAIITHQHLYVDKLNENWKKGSLQDRAEIKVRTHQPLKSEGEKCKQCHSQNNGLLDMSALGASDEQLEAYERNSIAAFFKHYGFKNSKETSDKKVITDNIQSGMDQQESIQRIRITELLN